MSASDANELVTATIYQSPLDYPGKFVVRLWRIRSGSPPVHDPEPLIVTSHLDRARLALPRGMVCLGRQPDDDPTILETWI